MASPNSSPLHSYSDSEPVTKVISPPPTPPTSEYTDSECEKEDSWSSQASEYSKGTSDDEYGDPEDDGSWRRRRATRKPLRRGPPAPAVRKKMKRKMKSRIG